MSIKDAVKLIEESEARFVDLRFTDTKGKPSLILSTTIPPLSLPATLSIRPTAKAMTATPALSHAAPKPT